jgi:hypothetical protein
MDSLKRLLLAKKGAGYEQYAADDAHHCPLAMPPPVVNELLWLHGNKKYK